MIFDEPTLQEYEGRPDEEMEAHYKSVYEEIAKEEAKVERNNNRIFKAIENRIGKGFLADLKTIIEESECKGAFNLVQDIPKENYWRHYQKEDTYGCITGLWVEQYSVGDSGDSFVGTIWVKLTNKHFIEMPFSC